MITYTTVESTSVIVESVRCDVCKKVYTDNMDIQEFVHIHDIGGFGSAVGDEVEYAIDICSKCVVEKLGAWLRFP